MDGNVYGFFILLGRSTLTYNTPECNRKTKIYPRHLGAIVGATIGRPQLHNKPTENPRQRTNNRTAPVILEGVKRLIESHRNPQLTF